MTHSLTQKRIKPMKTFYKYEVKEIMKLTI